MPEVLELNADPRPNGFTILRKWCAWTVSWVEEDVTEMVEGVETVTGQVNVMHVNATVFSMLVDFLRDGQPVSQWVLTCDRAVVGGDQELWNTKMENVESMTSAQIAALPKVMAIINEAAKTE